MFRNEHGGPVQCDRSVKPLDMNRDIADRKPQNRVGQGAKNVVGKPNG